MIGYIEIPLSQNSKEALSRWVKGAVDPQTYCFLKRKGGDVTNKAHLTLFFGLLLDQINQLTLKKAIETLPPLTLVPKGVSRFHLPHAACDALVLTIENTPELKQAHLRFRSFPHTPNQKPFSPHITLAYIDKAAPTPKEPLHLSQIETLPPRLRIFGPRPKH